MIQTFYTSKTIQPNYQFWVDFSGITNALAQGEAAFSKANNLTENHFLVKNIKFPVAFPFKKEIQDFGPTVISFSVMDKSGLNLEIEMEEDKDYTILQLITALQKMIINENGTYNAPRKTKFPLRFYALNPIKSGDINIKLVVNFINAFYMEARQNNNYDYAGNEVVSYTLNFGYDNYNIQFNPTIT